MSFELELRVVGAEEVSAKLQGAAARARERLREAVSGLGIDLLRKVAGEKLGPGKDAGGAQVLGVKTGNLRRSITQVTTDSGDTITSRTGTNLSYGRAWELGFDGDVAVRAHERIVSQVFGRPVAPFTQHVGPSSRHVHMVAKPYLTPSLAEMRERIRERLTAAVAEVCRGS